MIEFRHPTSGTPEESIQKSYNEIYKTHGLVQGDRMYQWFINLLVPQMGCSLLDISCGEGRLTCLAQKQGLRAFGMDFAIAGVQKGQTLDARSGWAVADGEKLPVQEGSFDYVTHIGSLEHYHSPQAGANEISRVLKPGGKACVMLPNLFGLAGCIRHVIFTGDVYDDGQPLQRYATRRQWETILQSAGLVIERVTGYEGSMIVPPKHLSDWGWFITHPTRLLHYILSWITPLNLRNHFVFLCKKPLEAQH